MAATTKEIVRSDGVRLRQVVDGGRVTSTSYLSPDGTWQQGMPQAQPGTTWTQANGDHVSVGGDGQPSVAAAPHGVLDRIGQYAPYGIIAGMGYGALSDAGAFGAAAGGAPATGSAGTSAAASSPRWWGVGAGSAAGTGSGGASAVGAAAGAGATGGGFWKGLGNGLSNVFGGGGGGFGLPLAIGASTDLLGAYLSSQASQRAAQQQIDAVNKALDFEKQRYGDAQANFAPFISQGQNAVNTIGAGLMPTSGPAPTAANLAPQFTSGMMANAANNGQRQVTMRAPNGQTKAVPDFLVPHYSAAGATVVQ